MEGGGAGEVILGRKQQRGSSLIAMEAELKGVVITPLSLIWRTGTSYLYSYLIGLLNDRSGMDIHSQIESQQILRETLVPWLQSWC